MCALWYAKVRLRESPDWMRGWFVPVRHKDALGTQSSRLIKGGTVECQTRTDEVQIEIGTIDGHDVV